MNGYLVLVRCGMDDLPVAMVDDLDDAIEIADSIDPEDSQHVDDVVSLIGWPVPSVFIGVSVIKFSEGHPVEIVYGRSFDEEQCDIRFGQPGY